MSLNPLSELKRRLDDDSTPLPKRLCLAKNIVLSHHFPSAPKESIVGSWLEDLTQKNSLEEKELKNVLNWITVDELTSELKSKLIQIVSQYLKNNQVTQESLTPILSFLENEKISKHLTQHIDDYLNIIVILLRHFSSDENANHSLCLRILNGAVKYYRDCKKKLEFIVKLLDGENLEVFFHYLNTEFYETAVINLCQTVLFPMSKKSFFVSFLQTLIKKDNIDDLLAEKGDNIQSVLKIMSAFFTFPKGRTEKDPKFLSDFIQVFVSCFKHESQMIFAFYVMVANSLNMNQSYLNPAMKMPPINFEANDEKIKRSLFLKMLEVLLKNEVDISVRLTDTFGEKVSKVEIKKNFLSFLQAVMMGQLKLEGKIDKTTLQIIKIALKLDPVLIEQKMDQILPPIMVAKKTGNVMNEYTETFNCLLGILFKLSRGTIFVNQILPHVKLCLEAGNTEQFELKQKIKEAIDNGEDTVKLKSKLITGSDIFPAECVEMYGKWTSELMFRQNKELLVSLQKDFEEHCIMMLEEGFVSPSIITLAEVLSAILSSFLRHCKMADHTVPRQIASDFWDAFQKFEDECLGKLGKCVLRLSYDPQLTLSFLKLSQGVAQLKLLNIKYSHTKLDMPVTQTSEVLDLSVLIPCLNADQWNEIAKKVIEDEAVLVLDTILLVKTMAFDLMLPENADENDALSKTKSHLIKQLTGNTELINDNGFSNVLFNNLDKSQVRQLAKILVKMLLQNNDWDILKRNAITNNRSLLNAITLETTKNMSKCFENLDDLTKAIGKSDFNIIDFAKEVEFKQYLNNVSLKEEQEDTISNCLTILKQLPLPYLEESYQLVAIFMLLATKKCCQKKIRKSVDQILLNIYELTPKNPDLYKIFPVEFIFDFDEKILLNLLTLKLKTSNNMFIIKCVLETGVKKVKTDSEIVKKIVDILLSKQRHKKSDMSSIEYFSDPAIQNSCIILTIITKEKRAITTSNYRSILANLQETLLKSMLNCFKNIDFGHNSSLFNETTGNTDDSLVVSENTLATLNAMAAYSLTLSKYCETTDAVEMKNLEFLWAGLEFFVQNAIHTIQNPSSKTTHVEYSIQLLTVILRYAKKLETHTIFENKDKLLLQIWKSIVARLLIIFGSEKRAGLEEVGGAMKFICELISVDAFNSHFVEDINNLLGLKRPTEITKDDSKSVLTSHKVSKYLWGQCLKAYIVGPKCTALSKLLLKTSKDLRNWIQMNYEEIELKRRNRNDEDDVKMIKIDDVICEILKVDLDIISEAVLAAKKINLDYKHLDSIFSLQHQIQAILCTSTSRYEVSWQSYFKLFEGCVGALNNMLMSREELLEDRWPNYMQCYRALVSSVCARAASQLNHDRHVEEKLAEAAHAIEKLTQSICKRKTHVSRIAAYAVADICSLLERTAPSKMVRQHMENSAALLLQTADSSYAAAFLRRALASSPGHVTLANMYTMYKRYHKYVGNA